MLKWVSSLSFRFYLKLGRLVISVSFKPASAVERR